MDAALWLLGAVLVTAAGVGIWVLPLRLSVSARFEASPQRGVGFACGVEWRALTLTAVGVSRVPARVELLAFGRPIWSRTLVAGGESAAARARRGLRELLGRYAEPSSPGASGNTGSSGPRSGDAPSFGSFLLAERRRLRLRELEIRARYAFYDVTLAGRLFGALEVVSAVLPPHIRLEHEVIWEFEDQIEVQASGRMELWFGRLLVDAAGYALRMLLRPSPALPPAPTGVSKS